MKNKLLSRLLAGFLAVVTAAGSMMIAGAASVRNGTAKVVVTGATITPPENRWGNADFDFLWVNGGTVNLNPGAGTTKISAKTIQLKAYFTYGYGSGDSTSANISNSFTNADDPYYDVTASADVKWYVGPVSGYSDGAYTYIGATDELTTTLANAGVDGYGTYVKKNKKGEETATKLSKGLAISVSKGKVSVVLSAANAAALLNNESKSFTEYVKLYSYDPATKIEKLVYERPVTLRYAAKDVKLVNDDGAVITTKWKTPSVAIGDVGELNIGTGDGNKALVSENTYTIKSDVPGAISFAIDKSADGSANVPDDGVIISSDIGWYPMLTGVTQAQAMQLWYRAQSLKDVVKAALIKTNQKWINPKYLDDLSDPAAKATRFDLRPAGASLDTIHEDAFTSAITAKIGEGKTYRLLGDAYEAYEKEYDNNVAKLKDKATAANIVIINEQSGKSLKLKVNIQNNANPYHRAFSDTSIDAMQLDSDPRNIVIPDTGRSLVVYDLYEYNAILTSAEKVSKSNIESASDVSAPTTTVTEKATVMVIADDAQHSRAQTLIDLSVTSIDTSYIQSNLMKLSKGVYNFALNTAGPAKLTKPAGVTISAKMLPNNAQVQVTVNGKTLGEPIYATIVVGYGQKFAALKDVELYSHITVIPIRIQNDDMVGAVSKFTVGKTSVAVNTGNVNEYTGKIAPDDEWNAEINDAFGIDGTGDGTTYTTVKSDSGALNGELKFTVVPSAAVADVKQISATGDAVVTSDGNGKYTIAMKDSEAVTFAVKMEGYSDGAQHAEKDRYYIFEIAGKNMQPPANAAVPVIVTDLPETRDNYDGSEPLTLSVTATASDGGKLSYEWFIVSGEGDDIKIEGQTAATLNVEYAYFTERAIEGSQSIYCKITNTNNRATADDKTASIDSGKCTFNIQAEPI
jgi:hypothetical protein